MIKKFLILALGLTLLAACSNDTSHLTGGGNVQPGTMQDFVSNVGDRVFFPLNSPTFTDEGRTILQRQAQWLNTYPNLTVTIEGHADERGTREYNIALGARRAEAARSALISYGVAANRIKTVSYGKERPVVLGDTENSWSLNRRAVTVPNFTQ